MSEPAANALLELIKEKGLVDDLQFEEIQGEHSRSGKSVVQIVQDFGILDLSSILQMIGDHLGAEVVSLRDREFPAELLKIIPANMARMYQCMPVDMHGNMVRMAFADPLNPSRADELGFVIRKDVQLVVADPAEIVKTIERFYGTDDESVSDMLKDLGSDKEIEAEVSAAAGGNNVAILADIANEVPIIRFVNIVLSQAVQDRASDIHFEPFE